MTPRYIFFVALLLGGISPVGYAQYSPQPSQTPPRTPSRGYVPATRPASPELRDRYRGASQPSRAAQTPQPQRSPAQDNVVPRGRVISTGPIPPSLVLPASVERPTGAIDANIVQAAAEMPMDEIPDVKQESIDVLTKKINESSELDDEQKTAAIKRLRSATTWLQEAKAATEKSQQYEAEIAAAPTDIADVKEKLASPKGEPQFTLPPMADRTYIQQQIQDVEARLTQAKKQLADVEASLMQRNDRQAELAKLLGNAEQRVAEAKKQLADIGDDATLIGQAKRLDSLALLQARLTQSPYYALEQKRHNEVADLLPLKRDWAKREVAFIEKEAAGWRRRLATYRKFAAERHAETAVEDAKASSVELKGFAKKIAALAEERITLVAAISALQKEVPQSTKLIEQLDGEFKKLADRVEKGGQTATIGLLLRRHRDHVPDVAKCRERLRFVKEQLPKTQLNLIDLRDEREALANPEAALDNLLAALPTTLSPKRLSKIQSEAAVLLQSKRETLDQIIADKEDYVTLLGELEVAQQALAQQAAETSAYIDERVLWIQSSEPLGVGDLQFAWLGMQELAAGELWIRFGEAVRRQIVGSPVLAALYFMVGVLMLLCRGWFRGQLNRVCETNESELRNRFWPTIEAVVASASATAVWPALMWLAGWRLTLAADTSDFGQSIGVGLQASAFAFWLCQFTRQMFRSDGVCESHFNVPATSARAVRGNLAWLAVVGVPLVFLVAALGVYRDGMYSASLGRVAFVSAALVLAFLFHRLLRLRDGVLSTSQSSDSATWYRHGQRIIYVIGVGVPLALAILSASGYDYSARCLAIRLQSTLTTLLGFMLLHAIAARWLDVRKHRHAQKRAEQARASAEENDVAGNPEVHGAPPPVPEISEDETTVSQVRYILRYALIFAFAVSSYTIWSDVAPAFAVLDNVVVWSRDVEEEVQVTSDSGEPRTRIVSHKEHTTLKHLLAACLVLVVGYALARNLPAVFQVAVLEHMPLDNGQRYAAGMVFRYIVTLATVILATRVIGLTWSSIQWLAAAMTVGLGFGLQEIFANLVSGIIILFERPIRVGDLVTVAGVSGRVTRMQIRATTITDFDRRELIVPNKKFITEDVLNWTLSDDVNRIVIETGVAYGSDTALARELLLGAANDHPLVLNDPAPIATFDRFADSSLNFTLRCFLPDLENRLEVIHQLHSAIDERFRKAKIEIAFPQQDLHIRTIDAQMVQMQEKEDTRAA